MIPLEAIRALGNIGELKGTARYAGLLLAPAKGFGLQPSLFLPFGQKKKVFMLFLPIFGDQE